jgi:hypothetical protein
VEIPKPSTFIDLQAHAEIKKHIKEIHDGNGILHKGQKDIKTTTINFYKPHFEQNSSANIQSSVLVASLFEHSVSVEDTLSPDQPCTLQEISYALNSFAKDKRVQA